VFLLCVVQVADAMVGKDKVVTVKPGALMSEAAQLMVHNNVSRAGARAARMHAAWGAARGIWHAGVQRRWKAAVSLSSLSV